MIYLCRKNVYRRKDNVTERKIAMSLNPQQIAEGLMSAVFFRNACRQPILSKFEKFILCLCEETDKMKKITAYSDFVSEVYASGGDFGKSLADILECDDNVYARMKAAGKIIPENMTDCFISELKFFSSLTEIDCHDLIKTAAIPESTAKFDNTRFDFCSTIPARLAECAKYGYGMYARYGMFRVGPDGKLLPVLSPDTVELSSLIGYETERKQVLDNTLALIEGKPAANVLLCGDAGTGKSSTVKAVANRFRPDGVRLIELRKDQLALLPEVMGEIAENPLKFIIFVDDLSFACDDDGFGALKAALEGSASAKASNAVIYATSNRRHLVKETFSSRLGDDVHRNDTMEELMSLSERFGLTVLFSKPKKELYMQIVTALVKENGIEMDPKELELKAEAFALAKGGRSARVAGQFADSLLTQEMGK